MKRATVVGTWEFTGEHNRPAVLSVWEGAQAVNPSLGWVKLQNACQPENVIPDPNVCIVVVEEVDEELLDALDGDPRFFIMSEETL
jgi:hypothetical protein